MTTPPLRPFNGHNPILGKRVFVDSAATVIGNVALGDDTSVWPGAIIRGDMHHITIGARCSVQDGAVLHITHASTYNPGGWPLSIGEEVTIGHNVTLHGCQLGNRILVGIGATVMDGAVVEDNVVIGAGTLVPPRKRLVSGYLYLGSPCKQARPLSDAELAYFSYTASNYVDLKNQYLTQTSSPR